MSCSVYDPQAAFQVLLSVGLGWKATEFPSQQVDEFFLQLEGAPRMMLSEFPLTARLSLASGSAPFSTKVNSSQFNSTVDGKSWILWENGH